MSMKTEGEIEILKKQMQDINELNIRLITRIEKLENRPQYNNNKKKNR